MRLVKVKTPTGKADDVARVAFASGISTVSVQQVHILHRGQIDEMKDIVDVETSTPVAKAFVDALMAAPFFDREHFEISVRQPRSLVSKESIVALTRPLAEPSIDICQELWQFSHVTYGFIGRIFIGGVLLAHGLIKSQMLFMIAGLLFIPLLPLTLAGGFGLSTREFRLAAQGTTALLVATLLLIAGGLSVALLSSPPLLYNESSSLLTGVVISLAVGVAAGLATADDAGRRELIGLAATAQIAIVPVWLGVCAVFGYSAAGGPPPSQRALSFLLNVASIVAASCATYAILGMKGLPGKQQEESKRPIAAGSTRARINKNAYTSPSKRDIDA